MEESGQNLTIGIAGAGVMGIDVAITFASKGYQVIIMDISEQICSTIQSKIKKNVRSYKMMNMSCSDYNTANIIRNISVTQSYQDFKEVDWVIENITESKDAKIQYYKNIDQYCKESVHYGINTSCISITELAQYVKKPENVIGLHFMNPVPLKECVESVRGYHTSDETIQAATELLKTVDKKMVLVNDLPGFVANRLSHLFMNEAAFLVQDQVAEPKDIDMIFKSGYGHKMGPLETADLIGLDTVVNSLNILYESYQDPKFRCCPLLKKMVNAGLLGKKTGQGFYKY